MSRNVDTNADRVLDDLAARGIAIEVVGGRLRLSPRSAVDEALAARVAAHKPGILLLLAGRLDAAAFLRLAAETVAESCRLPPDVLAAGRRGSGETAEEARARQAAAIERLRLDREAFVKEARRAGVYRELATDTGGDVP